METLYHIKQVLKAYARDAEALYKGKLQREDKIASGDLINSVKTHIVGDDGTGYEVTMDLAYYWKFIEGGSKGTEKSPAGAVYPAHWPPVNALLNWIQVKPVIPRPLANGKLPTPNQLAYLIGRKIHNEGIAPVPALAETLEELNDRYLGELSQALALDVGDYLYSTLRR